MRRLALPFAAGLGFLSITALSAAPVANSAAAVAPHPMLAGWRFASATAPPTTAQCEAAFGIACYQPFQVQKAYNLDPLYDHGYTGRGETIVLVDSYGSPTIRDDLATFDQAFNLPAPPEFDVIQPAGAVPPYQPSSIRISWAAETTLDVEWAHTIAPGAKLLLVETPVAETEGTVGFPQIVTAENYVIDHHLGDIISQSFGATEETFPSADSLLALRSAYINAAAHDVSVLAATGDAGASDYKFNGVDLYLHRVSDWPSTDPLVTAVGGTELQLDASGNRTSPDTVWNDTNNVAVNQYVFGNNGPNAIAGSGGKSAIFDRPAFQDSVRSLVGDARGVPDISMSGSCSGQVLVYWSFGGLPAGWNPICGTSEASPLFAGIVAIADQYAGHDLGDLNPALYALNASGASGIVDVTIGDNTVSFTQGGKLHTVTGFSAGPGYDLASGIGTVNAALFVPELAAAG